VILFINLRSSAALKPGGTKADSLLLMEFVFGELKFEIIYNYLKQKLPSGRLIAPAFFLAKKTKAPTL